MIDLKSLHPGNCNGYKTCRRCFLAVTDPRYRAHYGHTAETIAAWLAAHPDFPTSAATILAPVSGPCVHLGKATGERRLCPSCRGHVEVKVMACALHGQCTTGKPIDGLQWCGTCPDRREALTPHTSPLTPHHSPLTPHHSPLTTHRFDETNLFPEIGGKRLNASIAKCGDQWALAFRTGWYSSQIHLAFLDRDFKPIRQHRLEINHKFAAYGKEDPRLFWHRGQLWLSCIGVYGIKRGEVMQTHQLYADLDENFQVTRVIYPDYHQRADWEKNWGFFDWEGQLHAAYSIHPHRVLAIDGHAATVAHETDWPAPMNHGLLRGGAAPVRVGDEFFSWFHWKKERPYTYALGVYTFEARPPFRPLRVTREPILTADPRTKPPRQYCPVIFPCGAVLAGDRWLVSAGIHDDWVEVLTFPREDIERRLT